MRPMFWRGYNVSHKLSSMLPWLIVVENRIGSSFTIDCVSASSGLCARKGANDEGRGGPGGSTHKGGGGVARRLDRMEALSRAPKGSQPKPRGACQHRGWRTQLPQAWPPRAGGRAMPVLAKRSLA